MTIHYHGTPITPLAQLGKLAGRHFCVSYARPDQIHYAHALGQSVMLDNGAYTLWMQGAPTPTIRRVHEGQGTDFSMWLDYYAWAEQWLEHRNTWAVIPDVIGGGAEINSLLVEQWPKSLPRERSAPVWHVDESISRLLWMVERWPRVCLGSSGRFATIGDDRWHRRMDNVFNRICDGAGRLPCDLHMLRGMSLADSYYPFTSLDSTDIARHHSRGGSIQERADRWDGQQCPAIWHRKAEQQELLNG